MNDFPFGVVPMVALIFGLIQLSWHVAVIVFLYKIWKRVKHLPAQS
jgi:hypothetical protein